jgi:addiction module HigA family antidote
MIERRTAPGNRDFSEIATGEAMAPVHPGAILREEFLNPLEITPHALSLALRVPAPRINDVVREKRAISPETALRLARYFGTTATFWMNLQANYDLRLATAASGEQIEREIEPLPPERRALFALAESPRV